MLWFSCCIDTGICIAFEMVSIGTCGDSDIVVTHRASNRSSQWVDRQCRTMTRIKLIFNTRRHGGSVVYQWSRNVKSRVRLKNQVDAL